MLQEDSAYRQFTTDYRNWCWIPVCLLLLVIMIFYMSSIASNHDLSSLCYRRIQHTDNLPLIIGIGVGVPVCLLLLVIMIYLLCYRRILQTIPSSVSSIESYLSLCFRRIQHTDNLPLIIGIGVGIPVCLLLLVIMIYLLNVTGGFSIQTIYH